MREDKKRHEKFQFGHNPMKMTPFEMELAYKEKKERKKVHDDQTLGIQGRDGGCFPDEEHQQLDY